MFCNTVFFFLNNLDVYSFAVKNNLLELRAGSLLYVEDRIYEIYVSTSYFGLEYFQKVEVTITKPPQIPINIIG